MTYLSIQKKSGYALVTFNKPETLNALNTGVLREISATVKELEKDATIRVLLWTGAGKAFIAGADISEMKDLGPKEAFGFASLAHEAFGSVANSDLVSVALVGGFALGGGLEFALSCDIRYASSQAKLGLPETGLGLIPGFGGTQRLLRATNLGIASEWIFSGRIYTADEALAVGVLQKVLPPEQLLSEGEALAEAILTKGPQAVLLAKSSLQRGGQVSLTEGIRIEQEAFASVFGKPESKEGLGSFLEKRKPQFPKERT